MINLLLCLNLAAIFHAGHTAEYHYRLDGGILSMKAVIEQDILAANPWDDDCDATQMMTLCTISYLERQCSIEIDGKPITLEFISSVVEDGHMMILMEAELTSDEAADLQIINRCFYEFDGEFRNRILVDIGKFQGSYVLDKDNTQLRLH